MYGGMEDTGGTERGLSYEDYLRILMTLTDLDTLTVRAMNIVEADIRQTPGNSYFRLDACYAEVEALIRTSSSFGYHFELRRKRAYR